MKLPHPFRSVRARLTLWNVVALALVLVVLGGILRVSIARNLEGSVNRQISARASVHQEFWAIDTGKGNLDAPPRFEPPRGRGPEPGPPHGNGPDQGPRMGPPPGDGPGEPPGRPRPPWERPNRRPDWQERIAERGFTIKGKQMFPPGQKGEGPWSMAGFLAAARGERSFTTETRDGQRIRVCSAPLTRRRHIGGVIQVAYSLADVDRALRDTDRSLLALLPVALALAAVVGLLLTGHMLRPVRRLNGAAARIGAENLAERLPVQGHDEFGELATTFNGMLGRLEQAFEQQRRFTADASHELRTPLTIIKGNAGLVLSREDLDDDVRRSVDSMDRAATAMNRTIRDLLLLARADAGQMELTLAPTHLCDIIDSAVEAVRRPDAARICSTVEEPGPIVNADAGTLSRLFVNLLDNALRHTPRDGMVTVSAAEEDRTVVVTVQDTGEGIPPEHLPHICERFYRVDAARTRAQGGTGLGLSICQSIAEAHGGTLSVSSGLGAGTTVRVVLPAVRAAG